MGDYEPMLELGGICQKALHDAHNQKQAPDFVGQVTLDEHACDLFHDGLIVIDSLDREVIEEFGFCIQFLLEDVYAVMIEDVAYLAFGIEEVAEFASADRADLNAGRVATFPCALDAERAFFNNAQLPWTIPKILHIGI